MPELSDPPVDRAHPAPSETATTCRGLLVVALRALWAGLALLALIPAAASFYVLLRQHSLELLTQAGAFAIEPSMVAGLEELGLRHEVILRADLVFRFAGMLTFAATGLLIAVRKSGDWMTALVSFMLLAAGVTWFAPLGALPHGSPLASMAGLVGTSRPFDIGLGRSLAGLSMMLFLYLFPDGRFVPRWTRYAATFLVVHFLLWRAFPGTWVDPRELPSAGQVVSMAVVIASALFAQVYRYLAVSTPPQRQQTKLVVGAQLTIALVPLLLFMVNPGLGAGLEDLTLVTPRVQTLYNLILLLVLGAALFVVPISIAISVFRYRLWDIDLFLSRTLVYGALTGILGLAYFVVVAVVSAIADKSYITAAAATLAVAALFQPLRRRLQDLIDKQFFRRRYDAARTLDAFTTRLRQQIDLETLSAELLKVVEETMLPTGVSLWVPRSHDGAVRPDAETLHRIRFWVVEGRRVSDGDFDEVTLDAESMSLLKTVDGPVDLDAPSVRSEALARFRDVKVRLAVPLVNQGELVGILNLGPRMSDSDYSTEDRKLLDNLSDHAAAAVRVALLVREHEADLRGRERIQNEMRVAQLVQQQFVSKSLPEVQGWRFWAHYHPAREVGGDFYDVIELPEGRICVVAGDVTGKGVPAALVMASTRSILRGEAARSSDPARILEVANEQLVSDIPEQMFVTCLCAIVDLATGRMVYANAGHNFPYLRTFTGVEDIRASGMPLGLMSGIAYDRDETQILPGQSIVLHSDGLTEARNSEREMFGFPRVRALVEGSLEPESMIDILMEGLLAFTGEGWDQDDDITLVVVHRSGDILPSDRWSAKMPDGASAPSTSCTLKQSPALRP